MDGKNYELDENNWSASAWEALDAEKDRNRKITIKTINVPNALGNNSQFHSIEDFFTVVLGRQVNIDLVIGKDLDIEQERDSNNQVENFSIGNTVRVQIDRLKRKAKEGNDDAKVALDTLMANLVEGKRVLFVHAHGNTGGRIKAGSIDSEEKDIKKVLSQVEISKELQITPARGVPILFNDFVENFQGRYDLVYFTSCNPGRLDYASAKIPLIVQSDTNDMSGSSTPKLILPKTQSN